MSDGQASEWRPQGEGPHPTLAGNILDPGVKADGRMEHGQGVGGTSEQHVREEGLEHIKANSGSGSGTGIGSGSGVEHGSGIGSGIGSGSSGLDTERSATGSGLGADDTTGRATEQSGSGVSGAAHVHSPV